jgi:hypothetical protein
MADDVRLHVAFLISASLARSRAMRFALIFSMRGDGETGFLANRQPQHIIAAGC